MNPNEQLLDSMQLTGVSSHDLCIIAMVLATYAITHNYQRDHAQCKKARQTNRDGIETAPKLKK